MKHSDAQQHLARLTRNLYDDSPEKAAILAASAALAFTHRIACHGGPVAIPAETLFKKIKIEAEPLTVLEPKLKPYQKPSEGVTNADADPVDERSAAVDPGHDESRGVA